MLFEVSLIRVGLLDRTQLDALNGNRLAHGFQRKHVLALLEVELERRIVIAGGIDQRLFDPAIVEQLIRPQLISGRVGHKQALAVAVLIGLVLHELLKLFARGRKVLLVAVFVEHGLVVLVDHEIMVGPRLVQDDRTRFLEGHAAVNEQHPFDRRRFALADNVAVGVMNGDVARKVLDHDRVHRAFLDVHVPCNLAVVADKQNAAVRAVIAAGDILDRRGGLLDDVTPAVGGLRQDVRDIDIDHRICLGGVLV